MVEYRINDLFDDIFSFDEKEPSDDGGENDYMASSAFTVFDEPLKKDCAEERDTTTRFPSENFLHLNYPVIDK